MTIDPRAKRKAVVVEIAVLLPISDGHIASEQIAEAREMVLRVEKAAPQGALVQVREVRVSP